MGSTRNRCSLTPTELVMSVSDQSERRSDMPSEGIVALMGGLCGAGSAILFDDALVVGLGTGVGVAVLLLIYIGVQRFLL